MMEISIHIFFLYKIISILQTNVAKNIFVNQINYILIFQTIYVSMYHLCFNTQKQKLWTCIFGFNKNLHNIFALFSLWGFPFSRRDRRQQGDDSFPDEENEDDAFSIAEDASSADAVVCSLAWGPSGRLLALGLEDGTVMVSGVEWWGLRESGEGS